jgi:hypothetical protein
MQDTSTNNELNTNLRMGRKIHRSSE